MLGKTNSARWQLLSQAIYKNMMSEIKVPQKVDIFFSWNIWLIWVVIKKQFSLNAQGYQFLLYRRWKNEVKRYQFWLESGHYWVAAVSLFLTMLSSPRCGMYNAKNEWNLIREKSRLFLTFLFRHPCIPSTVYTLNNSSILSLLCEKKCFPKSFWGHCDV